MFLGQAELWEIRSVIFSCCVAAFAESHEIITCNFRSLFVREVVRKRFSLPLKLPILQPLSAVICHPYSAPRPHRGSYCVSSVGAKSLRALHVSGALFRLLPAPVTPPLCLFQGTQESYFTQGALVFVLPNIVSQWTIKGDQSPHSSLRLASAGRAALLRRQQTMKILTSL